MALPNPIYIGQNAIHQAPAIRQLAYATTAGASGVMGTTDCRVKQLDSPAGAVQCLPGGYMVASNATASAYEGYSGKWDVAETVAVPNVGSGGPRSDLIVLVIKDPYVSGAGAWDEPADLENGPYAEIVVIQNVTSSQWFASQTLEGADWSAITLAKITRLANSTTVVDANITDVRSLAGLGGTRTVVEQVSIPPIAQQVYASSVNCNNNHVLEENDLTWIDFPSQATWQVPVPSWAATVSVMMMGTPASRAHAWGEVRLNFGGTALSPREFDINNAPDGAIDVYRAVIPYGGVYTVPTASRGTIATVKVQMHSNSGATTARMLIADKVDVDGSAGCYFDLWLLFQRAPGSS